MANGTPEAVFDLTEMNPIRGEESLSLANLEKIAKPLGDLALAIIPQLAGLKELDVHMVEIVVEGPDEIAGRIPIKLSDEGEALVRILGKLGGELPAFRGVPWIANFDGTFFRQATEGDPVIVDGDSDIKKGQMIAWCFKTKGVQWPENALMSGIVHFAIEDDTPVKKGETVMYYIEESK